MAHRKLINKGTEKPRAAEFFAGIGLVRLGLQQAGFQVVFANDIEPAKRDLYVRNFGSSDFLLEDVRNVTGRLVPDIEIATASFPCTDLSLAGNRAGLQGGQSSMFWEFARILDEMGARAPRVIMLENVPSFASSRGGADLAAAIQELNSLGYICDLFVLDAKRFLPQSRPRLFIVGSQDRLARTTDWRMTDLRPSLVGRFLSLFPDLDVQAFSLLLPESGGPISLSDVVEQNPSTHLWWDERRVEAFVSSLSPINTHRLDSMKAQPSRSWATAYRRTRQGSAVWEIRADSISGCLRTARGGSSKQALVDAGSGEVRVRWMTAREYARLQGAPDFALGNANETQALFGFGDAVCVPAVAWIAEHYLRPLADGELSPAPPKPRIMEEVNV